MEEGGLFAFLGPNGAGKSTTINMICTFLRPDGGWNPIPSGHPTVDQELRGGVVINTMNHGESTRSDGFRIRRSTVEHAIPCLTSLDTARALQHALGAMRRRRIVSVVALQDLKTE